MAWPFILEIILSHIILLSYLQFLTFSFADMKSACSAKIFQENTEAISELIIWGINDFTERILYFLNDFYLSNKE